MLLFVLQFSSRSLANFERKKRMDESSVKENLIRAREACGLSQTEVASRLGINRASLVKLEKGRTRILNKHIPDMAQMYGVSVEALFLGYEPSPESAAFLEERRTERNQLIDDYENRLKELRDKLRDKDELIGELRQNIRLLQEIKLRNEKDLEKFSEN